MSEPFTVCLIIVTVALSCWAFQSRRVRDRLLFRPDSILVHKEYHRLFSSALIHADLAHLAFNMISFYLFGVIIEDDFGPVILAVIYLLSVLGGSLLSLYLHRHHEYSAVGASGGVCGVIFAAIFLVPGLDVRSFFLPLWIPGPVYAIGYLAWTFYALRRGIGNVGHDAHFGGSAVGLLAAVIIAPRNCIASPVWFTLSCLFVIGGLYLLLRDPQGFIGRFFSSSKSSSTGGSRSRDYDEAIARTKQREEIDRILEKITAKGMHSLTKKERATLAEGSAKSRR